MPGGWAIRHLRRPRRGRVSQRRQTVRVPRTDPALALPAGLVLGYVLDELCGDPQRGHPVALFGRAAGELERAMWRDDRGRGVAYVALAVGIPTLAAAGLDRLIRGGGAGRTGSFGATVTQAAYVAALTWTALGGRSLRAEAETMAHLLTLPDAGPPDGSRATRPDSPVLDTALCATDARGTDPLGPLGTGSGGGPSRPADRTLDLEPARRRLGHLCSRDATDLSADEIARAAVESVAENTADAVVAPLLWGALAGPAGIVAYRCANTLDAMVGYRSPRYARFGWAAARLDDALNLVPARLTAALTVALAPTIGGSPAAAWRAWRDDAPAHPSPNAGPVEATAAGALGVRLGGANTYGGQVEDRGTLGTGRAVQVADLPRVARLGRLLGLAGLAVCVGAAIVGSRMTVGRSGSGAGRQITGRGGRA